MSKGLESFYKMRDTLIAEGYNYPECLETMCEVEKALSALEIIKPLVDLTRGTNYCWLWLGLNGVQVTQEQYDLLKEVLKDE